MRSFLIGLITAAGLMIIYSIIKQRFQKTPPVKKDLRLFKSAMKMSPLRNTLNI